MKAALAHGKERVSAALAARPKTPAAAAGQSGLLIAEGDSWFDYPGDDVLSLLEERFGYRVESAAHHGDTVESMAYDQTQLKKLVRLFEHVRQDGRVPRAILLSGGGNDIAGDEFAVLLNHAASGLAPLNSRVVEGILEERLRFAIGSLIGTATGLSERFFGRKTPVFVHGYGHPVPDGRGYLGGFWFLPGPWLKPGFSAKAYDDLQRCTEIMVDLLDRFNALLQSIAGSPGFEHVTFVNIRGLLSNELPTAYMKSWDNELHPEPEGFARVATELDTAIRRVAPLPPAPGGGKAPQTAPSGSRRPLHGSRRRPARKGGRS